MRFRNAAPRASSFVHIHNETDIATVRSALISQMFGTLPAEVGSLSPLTSPIVGLTNLDSTQQVVMTTYTARPTLWTPISPNGNLFLLHQGHSGTYNQFNMAAIVQDLLTDNYTVCGLVMPGGTTIQSGSSTQHNADQDALSEFIGPVIVALNTLSGYSNTYMSGLSGGAWTTTVAAAVDPRIEKSYPIAGTLPQYMIVDSLHGTGSRDWEQLLPGITYDYLDLYLLGSCVARRQKQILHDQDACCFNFAQYESGEPYADLVASTAITCGGSFELKFTAKTVHEFDQTIFQNEVMADI